jgi:ribosome-binding protein aMBF1 (putative translation factor)
MSFKSKLTTAHPLILKEVLRSAREEKGMSQEELANLACLRKWHIKEIEESDSHRTFYSPDIKLQAVKRIGSLLGLDHSQFLILQN